MRNGTPVERAYLDTSVLGAYYCPEPLSAAADAAIRRVREPIISLLTEVEFGSLIARKRRTGDLTGRGARDILDLFGNHVAEGFYRRIAFDTVHFFKARELISAAATALRALDALHLAGAMLEGAPLLTADRSLAKAARHYKSRVMLLK